MVAQADDNTHVTLWCEVDITNWDPCQCESGQPAGVGDPILPEAGVQFEQEVDYKSPSGLLDQTRAYRSDSSVGWNLQFPKFLDYSQVAVLGGCFASEFTYKEPDGLTIWTGYECFPYTGIGSSGAQWIDHLGRQLAITDIGSGNYSAPYNAKVGIVKLANTADTAAWTVASEDNSLDAFNASGALLSHTLPSGQHVTYQFSTPSTPASIAPAPGLPIQATDSFGRSVNYVYNTAGYVSQFIDPLKQVIQYGFDTTSANCTTGNCNRVTSVTYQDGSRRTYQWNEPAFTAGTSLPNALTGITDENGARTASFTYDATGKAVATQRAGGADAYSINNRTDSSVTLRDPLGSDHVLGFTTILGTLHRTSTSQPAGAGNVAASTAQVFDTNGNLTSSDDFDQHRTCFTYDTTRSLETSSVEGLSTTASCPNVTAAGATLPADARKTSTTWHPDWRLPVQVAEPGRVTTYTYNGQAGVTCTPTTTPPLPNGKPIAVLCKKSEQATTDADGHLGLSAASQPGVAPAVSTFTYNTNGQVLAAKDPLGNLTTSTYYTDTAFTGTDPNAIGHTIGDLQTLKDSSGNVTQYTQYDKAGRLLAATDPNGIETRLTYWPRGWLKSSSAGSQTTNFTYWPTGLLKQATLPNGSTISYRYDDAHRLTDVADNTSNAIHYALDNAGNRTEDDVKDPSGVLQTELSRVMDALNRTQQTTGR